MDVRIAVLSGAGISAESGVPTFRDDETGLWAKYDPYELSSTDGWQTIPNGCGPGICGATTWSPRWNPNDGHRAVAAWQDYADVTVITQNVDDLHERAGRRPVHHLHGSLAEFWCDTCGSATTARCPTCRSPAGEDAAEL